MQVIASFALLTALWQTTLGSSLLERRYLKILASVNPFCSTDTTDFNENACTPTTNPTVSLDQL